MMRFPLLTLGSRSRRFSWVPAAARAAMSLRGDPTFDKETLSGDTALWFGRIEDTIANPKSDLNPATVAASDDLYKYGRELHTYVQSVLWAFRITGDLTLLNHVDDIAEVMRAELADGWRDTLDGTDGTTDGYLNWVWRYTSGDSYVGKDTHEMDEIKTHAFIALIAVALDTNRDQSPVGRDYAAHADFWKDYLVNHFEAKWRDRKSVATGFPFLYRTIMHAYLSGVKWHYYMGILTGDSAYTSEATTMAGHWWAEMRDVSTSAGNVYVSPQTALLLGGSSNILMPTVYVSMVFGDMVELHFEGFDRWADDAELATFARTMDQFIMDEADPVTNGYSQCMGGGVERAGLPTLTPALARGTKNRYAFSGHPTIAPWDVTGRVAAFTEAAWPTLGVNQTGMMLESGALLHTVWSVL